MTPIDIRGILEYLPHRYPFLLIDRVLELEPGRRIVAIKNVTINEPYFVGHFPHIPVMPGVLMIEALAQAAGVLSFETLGRRSDPGSVFYFVGIDGARFKRPVGPGDQLRLEVEIMRFAKSISKFRGVATVDGAVAAEAELMCTLREVAPPPQAGTPRAAEGA
ncbi:MAG TPA: 3-hydroxyacyl-ACP dehydratase FabZ [Burkholderiaceae bacterium]|nr:3-hydroxyacyl-ACP dehydratase FabZ [Burkholderiaceae bacterium]